MSHLRRFYGSLIALCMLVPALMLVTAPAAAQDDDEYRIPAPLVFVFANVMTNAERGVGQPDENWQVQVSIRTLNDNCTPTLGDQPGHTRWIDAGGEAGALLSVWECIFSITASIRDASVAQGCILTAQLAWGRTPDDADYQEGPLLTSSRPDGVQRISIRRHSGSVCATPNRTHFVIDGSEIVEPLPAASADADLLGLARRAAELAEFEIRVAPDPSTGARLPAGCDQTTTVDVLGDGKRVPAVVAGATDPCPMRVTGSGASPPFEVPEGRAVGFDGAGRNILVDVTRLARLSPARIVIIQDVTGSLNRGSVSYAISRSCGDASTDEPSADGATTPLYLGRFTVHGPRLPAFGATAVYPVGAESATSTDVVGCSVTVTVSGVPPSCAVAGGPTQTLTWSADAPFDHFDFEFFIGCGVGAADPEVGTAEPESGSGAPAGGTTTDPEGTSGDDAAVQSTEPEVRIVARKLANGKIEFGLQQRRTHNTWEDRQFPRARLFPTNAPVGRWLVSSPLSLAVTMRADEMASAVEVRIVARRSAAGRVEFGLQQRFAGGSWGDRHLPPRRFFPAGATVDRWLGSSVIDLSG